MKPRVKAIITLMVALVLLALVMFAAIRWWSDPRVRTAFFVALIVAVPFIFFLLRGIRKLPHPDSFEGNLMLKNEDDN
jgi:hypothetical protein